MHNNLTKEKEFKLKQFEKKAKVYEAFYEIYFKQLIDKNQNNQKDNLKWKKEMLIWASQEVIDIFMEIMILKNSENKIIKLSNNLILAIRKDLGYSDGKDFKPYKFLIKPEEHKNIDNYLK